MIKRAAPLVVLGAVAVAVLAGWPDIVRFLRIKQAGQSHPERVPAAGRTAYPQRASAGDADGTGDFDSASRGGPARA